jgi:hypothetical protein
VKKCANLTLEGEARRWYKSLPNASIDGWDSFQEKFMEVWADEQDTSFLLITFSIIKKNESEIISKFNTRFSKFYNRIPNTIRLTITYALVYYLEAFDGILGIFLESKEPQTLEEA